MDNIELSNVTDERKVKTDAPKVAEDKMLLEQIE